MTNLSFPLSFSLLGGGGLTAETQTLQNVTDLGATTTTAVTLSGGATISTITFGGITFTDTTGADTNLATGTAGTSGNVAMWNADGDIVDGSVVAANILVDGDIGSTVQAYDADILKADTTDTLTVGYATTAYDAGTKSSGTFTPDEANGQYQYAVNGGAHTLAPPTNNTAITIHYTNNGSAGTITTSGFTVVTGDSLDTTDTNEFLVDVRKVNDVSHMHVTALQ